MMTRIWSHMTEYFGLSGNRTRDHQHPKRELYHKTNRPLSVKDELKSSFLLKTWRFNTIIIFQYVKKLINIISWIELIIDDTRLKSQVWIFLHVWELNPGTLTPEARIIPLDQQANIYKKRIKIKNLKNNLQ